MCLLRGAFTANIKKAMGPGRVLRVLALLFSVCMLARAQVGETSSGSGAESNTTTGSGSGSGSGSYSDIANGTGEFVAIARELSCQ